MKASVGQMEAAGRQPLSYRWRTTGSTGTERVGTSRLFPIYNPLSKDEHSRNTCFPHSLSARWSRGFGWVCGCLRGARCSCACRGNWIGEAPYRTGRPCSECPPSYGGGCQNNLCYKGTWWGGLGAPSCAGAEKAGANFCLQTFH